MAHLRRGVLGLWSAEMPAQVARRHRVCCSLIWKAIQPVRAAEVQNARCGGNPGNQSHGEENAGGQPMAFGEMATCLF